MMGKDSKPKESSKGKGKQAAAGKEGKGKGGKSGDSLGTCTYVRGCLLPFCSLISCLTKCLFLLS